MRSAAEQEIRDAVVDRFRKVRPDGRVIHELNSAGQGSIRFDVACVCPAEILICEIKSEKDKLDRLAHQIPAMRKCGHHAIVAFHEKFLVEKKTNKFASMYERDGVHYCLEEPEEVGSSHYNTHWVFPETERGGYNKSKWKWTAPTYRPTIPLPGPALSMLWRDELYTLCQLLRVSVGKRSNMTEMVDALRWYANGAELTKGICTALRARDFAEADPATDGWETTL